MFDILINFFKNNEKLYDKIRGIFSLILYYKNLLNGIKSNKIYHILEKQNPNIIQLTNSLSDKDVAFINQFFDKDIKKYLLTQTLDYQLNFEKRNSSLQIGQNSIFIEKPIQGLWTTGKATFFIPTKPNIRNKINITFFCIVPMLVTVEFNNIQNRQIHFNKLTTKTVEFVLKSDQINEKITKISIFTDRLWLPNILSGAKKSTTLGICIRSIIND